MSDARTEGSCRVVEEFWRRGGARDPGAFDLVAEDFVNQPAGPQGREGMRATLHHLRHDLGELTSEVHHLLADGDYLVALHLTLHGRHLDSTMPLLSGVPVSGVEISWTFLHLFRVADGLVVEHWTCRDDVGLLRQVGA